MGSKTYAFAMELASSDPEHHSVAFWEMRASQIGLDIDASADRLEQTANWHNPDKYAGSITRAVERRKAKLRGEAGG